MVQAACKPFVCETRLPRDRVMLINCLQELSGSVSSKDERLRRPPPPRSSFAQTLSTPASMDPVMDRAVYQSDICSVEEAFRQAKQEAPPRQPFERRQDHFEKFAHVQTFWRHQSIDHANDERDRTENPQSTSDQFCVQHRIPRPRLIR